MSSLRRNKSYHHIIAEDPPRGVAISTGSEELNASVRTQVRCCVLKFGYRFAGQLTEMFEATGRRCIHDNDTWIGMGGNAECLKIPTFSLSGWYRRRVGQGPWRGADGRYFDSAAASVRLTSRIARPYARAPFWKANFARVRRWAGPRGRKAARGS